MSPQFQLWMPAILALFGSLIVVSFTAWINTRTVVAHIEAVRSEIGAVRIEMRSEVGAVRSEIVALRADFKKDLAELELRLTTQISGLDRRIERLEEQRRLVRP